MIGRMVGKNEVQLVDWFAGQALQGMLANPSFKLDPTNNLQHVRDIKMLTKQAYGIAAVMMLAQQDADKVLVEAFEMAKKELGQG